MVLLRTQLSMVSIGMELLSWILNNQGNPELFATIIWGIWHQRNQVCNHQPCCILDQLVPQAKEKLAAVPKPKAIWKPPDARFIKINFDGAIFRTENRSEIGAVVRDHTGAILASLAQSLSQHSHQWKLKQLQQHEHWNLDWK